MGNKLDSLADNLLVGVFYCQELGFIYINKIYHDTHEKPSIDKASESGKRNSMENLIACLESVLECFIDTQRNESYRVQILPQPILQLDKNKAKQSLNAVPKAYLKLIEQLADIDSIELVEKLNTLSSQSGLSNKSTPLRPRPALSQRENEVLCLICSGKTNKEIGGELNLSNRTVEKYRAHLLTKTNSKNTAQLVVFGIKNLGIEV